MSFKEMVAADIHRVFLNTDGFAELRTIEYNGERYEDIPVSIQNFTERDRPRITAPGGRRGGTDSAPGLYLATHVLYCAQEALGGAVLQQGKSLKIQSRKSDYFRKYDILSSGCEMGMLRAELRAVRQ